MKIDLYTSCYNDAEMLPYFFRHYDGIVQRYIVYDDESTDNSIELLNSHPKVELRPKPRADPYSMIFSALALVESAWKESRGLADWVIVTDIDEHLYHSDINAYLRSCKNRGVTIVPALGYEMLSDEFPKDGRRLCDSLTRGAQYSPMSKLNLFSPTEVSSTNFSPGRHTAAPEGNVMSPFRDELLLLHYKYINRERLKQRHNHYAARLGTKDLAMGFGAHYLSSQEDLLKVWDRIAGESVDISEASLCAWVTHKGPRWWEKYPRVAVE